MLNWKYIPIKSGLPSENYGIYNVEIYNDLHTFVQLLDSLPSHAVRDAHHISPDSWSPGHTCHRKKRTLDLSCSSVDSSDERETEREREYVNKYRCVS